MRRPPRILNTLLYLRELREERARDRLSGALSALDAARRDLKEVRENRRAVYNRLSGAVLSGKDLRLYGEGLEATFRETDRLERKLRARMKEVENLKKELEKAHLEKKVAEKYHEKLWQRFRREEEKAFYRELDDLTLMRRGRR
ncbi:flagellar export protein FliJ [Thermosulfurimonas sp. F29]|uniref:flagellar export protein FliJ n=1 Tax=Thermosulfurimonas sp. F29 TaxID=2867247 RepID=UPI001C8393B3|nr:hypothetical protein [Thermosulfurimonas sp. F29]MBX6423053.1 hypothetical protein [Thermosulfurimonas sp. F29]